MTTQTLVQGGDAGRWDQAIYAFLAEKERRSGSKAISASPIRDRLPVDPEEFCRRATENLDPFLVA